MDATRAVADFVVHSSLRGFGDDVVAQGKRCIIDGIGVILAGSAAAAATIVRKQIRALGGVEDASVLGVEPFAAPASLAARANAIAGHALDFDDTQLSNHPERIFGLLTHPTIPPLAAALAVGEQLSVSGARLLEAFLIGFEVECKIAEAINPNHYKNGFHSSGTIGAFGAATAAAKLLGLDHAQTTMAVGIVASLASGIRAGFGTMTKPLHVGRAAENGVVAAQLARLGFTADGAALDGKWGFFQVLGGGFDAERIIGALGNPPSILDPGVSVKPYPCGSLSHPSADAMLELVVENDVRPEQIDRIRVRAGSNILNPLRYGLARTELEAKFSLPFIMSSLALRRRAGIHEFQDEFVLSQPVQEMMQRVDRVLDPDIEAKGYDKMRSIIEIHLKDGRVLREPAEVYRGGPERPFTRQELHGKYRDCAEGVLDDARLARSLELLESLDELENIHELVETLANPAYAVR
ncbi:MAG: MmgE/PrpD family protein [Longimicrobiales bacterium]